MKRFGLAALVLACALVALPACEDESEEANQTGIELGTSNCVTFGIWLWVDDEYQGSYSSEEPSFIPIGAGSHTLYARSNASIGTVYYCWTTTFSVSDGKTTFVTLDCTGAECSGTR